MVGSIYLNTVLKILLILRFSLLAIMMLFPGNVCLNWQFTQQYIKGTLS